MKMKKKTVPSDKVQKHFAFRPNQVYKLNRVLSRQEGKTEIGIDKKKSVYLLSKLESCARGWGASVLSVRFSVAQSRETCRSKRSAIFLNRAQRWDFFFSERNRQNGS
jgi:hypothetical protein